MRALNMQALTDALKLRYPGIVVYGIGDSAHAHEVSDHNEDDTPGSMSEQTDADNNPEHRAIDAMLTGAFDKAEADALVAKVVADPASRNRLHYVIWYRHIWRANGGWVQEVYTGSTNPHTDHVHFSGLASDDENTAGWPVVTAASGSGPAPVPAPVHLVKLGDGGTEVTRIQRFFQNTFPAYRYSVSVQHGVLIKVDGQFGPQTKAWVQEFQKRTGLLQDGIVGPNTFAQMRKYGYQY